MRPRDVLRKTYIYVVSNERVMIANRVYDACPNLVQEIVRVTTRVMRKLWDKKYLLLTAPKHYYEDLDTITFYGMEFNIPSDAEQYLTMKYGKWKKPRKDWLIWRDDGGTQKNSDGQP